MNKNIKKTIIVGSLLLSLSSCSLFNSSTEDTAPIKVDNMGVNNNSDKIVTSDSSGKINSMSGIENNDSLINDNTSLSGSFNDLTRSGAESGSGKTIENTGLVLTNTEVINTGNVINTSSGKLKGDIPFVENKTESLLSEKLENENKEIIINKRLEILNALIISSVKEYSKKSFSGATLSINNSLEQISVLDIVSKDLNNKNKSFLSNGLSNMEIGLKSILLSINNKNENDYKSGIQKIIEGDKNLKQYLGK